MKKHWLYIAGLMIATSLLQGCDPLIGGAALGAAGAVAVYDRQSIKGTLLDHEIGNQILEVLKANPDIAERCHIEFTTYQQVILLVGQAPTQTLKEDTETLAKSVPHIRKFYNEITIEGPTSQIVRASDSWVTTKIKAQFLATKNLKSNQIKVLTENGTVFLMGTVQRSQANLAVTTVKKVAGVSKVVKVFEYLSEK